jgi:hypothetical protein
MHVVTDQRGVPGALVLLSEAGQTVQALEEEVAELRDNKAQCEAQLLQVGQG